MQRFIPNSGCICFAIARYDTSIAFWVWLKTIHNNVIVVTEEPVEDMKTAR